MEKWITRTVAMMIALGALGLFWTFGMFAAPAAQQGRLLALTGVEMQLLAVSFIAGLVVAWGALHLFALADRAAYPKVYAAIRIAMLIAAVAATGVGASWSLAHVVP